MAQTAFDVMAPVTMTGNCQCFPRTTLPTLPIPGFPGGIWVSEAELGWDRLLLRQERKSGESKQSGNDRET
jgi:hypothetical protein